MAEDFENPIDEDDITENPHSLEYPHHRGSLAIKPEDKGKIKGRAMAAMEQQTDRQMGQIQEQFELLAKQAKLLKSRVEISNRIYQANINFEPLIGHVYYLYEDDQGQQLLSLLSPSDWGKSLKKKYIAKISLLADHTWDVLELGEED
ncbi:MAG: hypothetical protein CL840_17150 [Crocinitomicaceae bacterium]|nr:hypothetical protein [Crocinitomicaceae bacterium]|tara:strand:- start:1231 stop:1674 length:444 start_codon:yes stop_codon:yes gene_type:complete